MIRYALFALPGPGDAVIHETAKAGCPPSLVVAAAPGELAGFSGPKVVWNKNEISAILQAHKIEMILIAGWEHKLGARFYRDLPFGAWNLHPSLLPKLRGQNPYFWAIRNGDSESGVALHELTDEIDAGGILLQKRIPIAESETLGRLWNRLGALAGTMAVEGIREIAADNVRLTPQDHTAATSAPRVTPEHLFIQPDLTRADCEALVRAANPYYGALLRIGEDTYKIFEVSAEGPGARIELKDGLLYATVLQAETYGLISGEKFKKLFR